MEDALGVISKKIMMRMMLVLILVLMEDALGERPNAMILALLYSLNPCFNGRCTRSYRDVLYRAKRAKS